MKTATIRKTPEIVYRRDKPKSVILDIDYYQELLERLEDFEDLKELEEMRKRPLKFRKFEDFLQKYEISTNKMKIII